MATKILIVMESAVWTEARIRLLSQLSTVCGAGSLCSDMRWHNLINSEALHVGYVSFENGVKAVFMGGSKSTPAPKMGVEVVGTTGRLIMDDIGDGRNKDGDWTGY